MSRIFDEKFEGTGYEESWGEAVGAGCTINEDAATSDVGSPSGWGSQCIKIISAASTANWVGAQYGDGAIRYTRVEVIFTDLSGLAIDNDAFFFASSTNNALSAFVWSLYLYRTGGVNYLVFDPWYDGSSHGVIVVTIAANTRYRFEVKWDKTNNLYELKSNGTSLANGSLVAGSIQQGALILGSTYATWDYWTGYFDLIAVDDAAWVGEEYLIVPVLMNQYRSKRN